MENASRALLIAAAVLVAIIIITIGIKIFSSTSDTQKIAVDTGKTISEKTKQATSLAIEEITATQTQTDANQNTLCQEIGKCINKDNYGDYIDLGQNVIGTSATTDDWRILYKDKSGHVYAILADYLPNSNSAIVASELNTEGSYNVYSSIDRKDLINKLENSNAWNSLISKKLANKGAEVKGAVTPEIIMESYNAKHETSLSYTKSPYLLMDRTSSNPSIDTLYMPHPGNSGYNGSYAFWLDSRVKSYGDTYVWSVECTGQINIRPNTSKNVAVRPVVSLPSNINVTNNRGIWILAE